jgi:hypothetical protein
MKRLSYVGGVALAALLVGSSVMACSHADASDDLSSDASADDGPGTLPVDGGGDASAVNDSSADADASIRTCTDEGWCHVVVPDQQTLLGIWGDGHGVVWTVSQQGNVLRWDGKAWIQSYSTGAALYAIWGSGPVDLWAGGVNGLYHGTGTSPDALTWTSVPAPAPVSAVYSIWGSGANDVWAVGDSTPTPQSNPDTPDFVIHYSGPGDEVGWDIDPVSTGSGTSTYFQRMWGTSADDVWLIGVVDSADPAVGSYLPRLLHRQSDGAVGYAWQDVTPPDTGGYSNPTYGGASISPDLVWLFGIEDTSFDCLTYSGLRGDGGSFTWTPQNPDPIVATGAFGAQDYAVWGTGPNDVWKAGTYGRLRHWDGSAWVIARIAIDNEIPVQNTIYGIWGSSSGDVWAVGDDIALHKVAP